MNGAPVSQVTSDFESTQENETFKGRASQALHGTAKSSYFVSRIHMNWKTHDLEENEDKLWGIP